LAFETPQNEAKSLPVIDGMTFPLYASHEDAQEKNQGKLIYYLMHFDGSVTGLSINSIVQYQGIKVGKVEDIQLKIDDDSGDLKIPVLVSLYVDKLSFESDKDDAKAVIERLVTKGWRGQLSTSNFILGTKVISLVFAKEAAAKRVKMLSNNALGYPEIPTVEGFTDKLASSAAEIVTQVRLGVSDARKLMNSPDVSKSTKKLADILDNMNSLLIEVRPQLVSSLDELSGTLKNTHALSGKLNKATTPLTKQMKQVMAKLDGALGDARKTLKTANTTLGEDSAMQYELRLLLEEVSEAANSFSVLADTIQRKPNALLLGK
jgi:paraquat-inducible protein B